MSPTSDNHRDPVTPAEPPGEGEEFDTSQWLRCDACGELNYVPGYIEGLRVCSHCGHHGRIGGLERLLAIVDEGSFHELDDDLAPGDPLSFVDLKPYPERIEAAQSKTGILDAFRGGTATVDAHPVQIGTFEFAFLGGSMGSVVGEKVTLLFERARDQRQPAIVISASGGARMQEGLLSLMQMAKTCSALAEVQRAGVPYISVLTHPTTGGVAASFAMLGDVILAEPGALIGFAGPRVIEQTIREKLPSGFQRAEYLLEHGMVDRIVDRRHLRAEISQLLGLMTD